MNQFLKYFNATALRWFGYAALAGLVIFAGYRWALPALGLRESVSESGAAAATMYTCPMHPQILQEGPGSCPICGMDLVPLSSGEHDHSDHDHSDADSADATDSGNAENGEGESDETHADQSPRDSRPALLVRLEPAMVQKMGVVTEAVAKQSISRTVRAAARVEFNERSETIINSRVDGWAEKLYADFEGQTVRRGQPLVGIYSPELVATQEEYLQLLQRRNTTASQIARDEIDRLLGSARSRLRNFNVSPAQIHALEQRGSANRLLTIHSPYSGVIVKKMVTQGQAIQQGMDLFQLADLSTVWVFVYVPEKDIPFVQEGMPATMELSQLPGERFEGQVSFVFPFLDEESRDLKVRLSFPNPDFRLKPGMFAEIQMRRELPGEFVTVPASAVIRTGERDVVFVHRGGGVFEAREIRVGVQAGDDSLQVLEGLDSEEAVAVSGQFLLDSEARMQEALRSLRRSKDDASSNRGASQNDSMRDDAMQSGGHSH